MLIFPQFTQSVKNVLHEVGDISYFTARFFKELFSFPLEFREFLHQSFVIGVRSLPLLGATAFIMGLVITLQTHPTLAELGAEAWVPSMMALTFIRELGPVVISLIFAGKIGSGIGAELGSMRVSEQIDAMEVSGTNPFKFLVVTRVMATTLMIPILVILSDIIGLWGSYLIEKSKGNISFQYYLSEVIRSIEYGDLFPATIKTFFFGFIIGIIGCFKGYYAKKGTAGVGKAANSAVVLASIMLFVLDFLAVFITEIVIEL